MIFCICLFIAIWLCRASLLGGETLKRAFLSSLLREFFPTAEFDSLVLKPEIFLK